MVPNLLDKKLDYWEHKLLDLSKRNKMINYRETKRTTIKLIEPSFEELFNRLALNEETLTFQRAVDRETDIRVFSILSLLEKLSVPLPVTIGDIKTEGSVLERQRTLKNMRSKARLALEEQGTNILYLSFGFIEWKDGKSASAQWIKSPLILVPVVLSLEALNSPYTLSKHEDDIVVNPTLEYYLKTEYGIELPHFDADKDTLDDYMQSLEEIADQRGWKIIREVSLGLLSFLKITMYNDLRRNEERIKKNPVIRAMCGDSAEVNDIPEELHTFDHDSINAKDCYQVMSADSSQQDAILYSKKNISFVMQGPPGTGKSQTITNIIAEALADGKKVLFVSEKMAALQVVYRRLQDAHLADFCLPLHSYKANKKEILEQIGANLGLKQTRVKDTAITNLEELNTLRQELNKYAYELHKLNPELNISCYEAYNKLEEVNDAPTVTFALENPLSVSQAGLQSYLNVLKEYSLSLNRLKNFIKNNPWEGLSSRISGYEYSEKMRSELSILSSNLASLIKMVNSVYESVDLSVLNYSVIPELADMLRKISKLPDVPNGWLSDYNIPQAISAAEGAKKLYDKFFALQEEIGKVFDKGIYEFDYNGWKEKLLEIASGFIGMPLISEDSPEYYVNNAASLSEAFTALKDKLSSASEAFSDINNLLGTSFISNTYNQQITADLLVLIKDNIILPQNWFTTDIGKIKALVNEAKATADQLKNCKEKILSEWESEILSLDYSPILLRYKTDYTSIFKVFNPQYRQDKKQIQALSKKIIKKLPDDVAVELLNSLKTYHEKTAWFYDKGTELSNALSTYYTGIDSDWDFILTAISIVEKLLHLPVNVISPRLIELLSVDHKTQIASLESLLSIVMTSFSQARNIALNKRFSINFDSSGFNYENTVIEINAYLSKLNEVSGHKNLLKPYLNKSDEQFNTINAAIEKLNSYVATKKLISTLSAIYKQKFDFLYTESTTDWDGIVDLLEKLADIKKSPLYQVLHSTINVLAHRKQNLEELSVQILDTFNAGRSSFEWVRAQFSVDAQLEMLDLKALAGKISGCLENIDILEYWIDYQEAKEDCKNNGLSDFISKIEDAELFTDIEKIFLKGFYHIWLGEVFDKSASLRRFRRNTHDERIKKFIELDDLQLLIAQMRIREKLIENLPSTHRLLKATDEVAILSKELSKKRNTMPLRKLFKLIPNLLMRLKPCLMMSPLSVSYFLETEAYHFDLVIFDEASQIFPEDAIGAILRGAQVIIAGDSKQLPPTNFFSATTNNLDSDYDITDDEDYSEVVSDSILEEAASVLPNRTLLWHYRSKHEGLIAFSNREIYKNDLITFPSSVTNAPDMGVEYIYVENGYYEGGGKNCNIPEAKKCVMLVLEHIQKHPDRSLGIIAFSEKQQAAIENAIIDFRERMPQYEWFFDESKDEPFFVKNLENVQGDERDTIIFSICYAKDKSGKMYMRFGPLGHAGGERRLNVAITRAKYNVKLVGSILPSDIDLNRTNSDGVRMLRSYIEYAIKGASALKPSEKEKEFEAVDEFCDTVAEFLENNGYKVKKHVGCSDYKIDIAIENPDVDGEFIAGIECDGISYVQARTARDRDHLRRTVLENMGWNLYRVWSTEWYRNPKAEGEALLNFIKSVYGKNGKVAHTVKQSNEDDSDISLDAIATETVKPVQKASSHNPYGFAYYKEANWWDANHSGSRDNLTRISEIILHIVRVEQPIHMELLYKRMAPSFTTGKVTEGVRDTIDEAIAKKLSSRVVIDKDRFIRLCPLTPITVRIPDEYGTPRPMEFISTEEVASAMIQIIKYSFGITEEDLASECARVFGFERKGPKIKEKTDAAIKYLVDNKKIRIIDGKVQLLAG
ncbi:DUF4011 domain-containing protein [Clostridium thermosuccinogenes]|uniref:DUF4011 domain-containing protein n=1 Tax=Clostridium thermosuccinogenes TaxID=84032 RepID=UPI000CCC1697|nr:DUF4011 domain-containing protein [Pseudoclostridium thermosuccinogenes]PNT92250.1 hypothetical protein CDQ83_01350 [Pseudoclostridium thermosuccinogenes]